MDKITAAPVTNIATAEMITAIDGNLSNSKATTARVKVRRLPKASDANVPPTKNIKFMYVLLVITDGLVLFLQVVLSRRKLKERKDKRVA